MTERVNVSTSDIARLADVGQAAVSNWRRRFADFPEPTGGTARSPMFALDEVTAWLRTHGREFEVSTVERVWQRVRAAAGEGDPSELVGWVGLFLLAVRGDPERWANLAPRSDVRLRKTMPEVIAELVEDLPGGAVERFDVDWIGVLRAAAELGAAEGYHGAYDEVLDHYLRSHARRLAATPRAVAELMIELAGVSDGHAVLDPACGVGTLLDVSNERGAAEVHGQDVDLAVARIALGRLRLHEASASVRPGDSLRDDAFPGVLVDAVITAPPFGDRSWGYDELASDPRWEYGLPPRGEPELAWVQHALAHLTPGGQAVIMMPSAAASRRPGRRIRGNLLRAGALRAVISLPAGTAQAAADLWVLRRPLPDEDLPSQLLVVAEADLAATASAWRAFSVGSEASTTAGAAAVRIIDVLDEDVDLSPARHLASRSEGNAADRYTVLRLAWTDLVRALSRAPELETEPAPDVSGPSVAELARAGIIAVHQAPLATTIDAGDRPLLTAKDVKVNRSPSGRGLAGPGAIEIEPGDVVVPVASREPAVRVAVEGGALLGPQLVLFRADPTHLDPHFLAGHLRAAAERSRGRGASTSSRFDLRRTTVPRVPVADQRPYADAFRALLELEEMLQHIRTAGEELIRAGIEGLANRSLRPEL